MRITYVAAVLLVTVPIHVARAQGTQPTAKTAQQEYGDIIRAEVEDARARLKLTADQEKAVREQLADAAAKLDALDLEYMKKEDEIVTSYRNTIRRQLKPEQQVEWDKIRDEWRDRVKARLEARERAMAPGRVQ